MSGAISRREPIASVQKPPIIEHKKFARTKPMLDQILAVLQKTRQTQIGVIEGLDLLLAQIP